MAELPGNSKGMYVLPKVSNSIAKSPKTYTCAICSDTFNKIKDYKVHYETHNPEQKKIAQAAVKRKRKLASEKPIVVAPSPSYVCPNCPQSFYKSGSYRRHLRSHLGIPAYFCRDCLVGFMEKSQLINHRKESHSRIKRYTCATCEKKFCHRHALIAHKIEHIAMPPYDCPKCPALFPTASRRARHLVNHTLKCHFCLKPYNTDEALNKHLDKKHPDGDDCEFLSDIDDTDVESHDSDFSELYIASDSDSFSDDSSKCYASSPHKLSRAKVANVCFICERRYSKKVSLDKHLNSHRIFRCSYCPKFFPKRKELAMHLQEHRV